MPETETTTHYSMWNIPRDAWVDDIEFPKDEEYKNTSQETLDEIKKKVEELYNLGSDEQFQTEIGMHGRTCVLR